MQQTARLAGFFAAHGVWSISDGATLIPMVGYEQAGGERRLVRFANEDIAVGAQAGRDALAANPDGAARAVLVVDAFLHLPAGRLDALVVEAVEYGPQMRSLRIGVPYRPQPSPGGFAVHRPKILELAGVAESEAPVLIEAFLAGVDSHERAAPIWSACLDDSL